MDYIKSAAQQIATVTGVNSLWDLEEPAPSKCNLYEGKMSAKIVLEYIEQKSESTEKGDDRTDNTNRTSTCCKEQFMRIEIQGSEKLDISSFVQQSGYIHVILAVDQSGSMSGSPMNQVKQALICLLEETTKQENIIVDIFAYNQFISGIKYTQSNYKQKVDEIRAGGLTYFSIVFDKIRKEARNKVGGKEVNKTVIVFLTDGSDTSKNPQKLEQAQKDCMTHLKTTPQATVVHVVGFSKDHDYAFMNEINHLGKQEGLFRYCEPGDGPEALRDKLAELFEHITLTGQEYFHVEVQVPDGLRIVTTEGFATKKQLPLTTESFKKDKADKDGATQRVGQTVLKANTWIYVEKEDPTPRINIKVLQSMNGEMLPLNCDEVEISGQAITMPVDKVEWSLNILERNIDLLAAKIGEAILKKRDLSPLENRLCKLQEKVSESKVFDLHIKKDDRKLLLDHVAELQTKLDGLHKMIAEVKRGESYEVSMLARANDLRYQVQFSKTRRHRLMDQRVRVNVDKMKMAQAELDQISVNRQDIEGLSAECEEFYICCLSQMNVKEIMLDPDDNEGCLGFGLAVKRPEHVLDDPTAVRICLVSGTLVSRSSMMEALNYKINVTGHLLAHGGFRLDMPLAETTVGLAREPINAWLPMYICESHWRRVKILLKPTLGYFCTLDPLGYNIKQTDVLFQVLGSMIGQLEPANCTEHQLKMIFAFQRLCVAVVKEFELTKTVTETVKNFLASPTGRTKDIVPNLFVLFGYTVCLPKEKLEELFGADSKERSVSLRRLWLTLLSESLRRAARNVYHEATDAQTDGILSSLIATGICNTGNSKPLLSDTDLLHAWRKSRTVKAIEIPVYNIQTGIAVPEMTAPKPNSDTVDKAMEVWAIAKLGIIRNKNQAEKVKKASTIVKKWVDEGHQDIDNAVITPEVTGDEVTEESDQPETPLEWTNESMKNFMSILQVVRKLTSSMYPRIGNITGYMAYVGFWLKHLPDFREMDNNSGLPPKDWVESVKSAVTTLSGSIEESGKTMAAEKSTVYGTVKAVVEEQRKLDEEIREPIDEMYDEDEDNYEYEEELPEEQVRRKIREAKMREPSLCEVLCVVQQGNSVDFLCAMLVQALQYHRNAAARSAADDGSMLDLKIRKNTQLTLEHVKKAFKEKEKAAILSAIEKVFWQKANYALLQAPTIGSFIGYLMNTYKSRGEGLSDFLKIILDKDRQVDIPLIAEKVKIVMMGKHKDHVVLSNGNVWMPEKKVCKKFAEVLGQEAWEAIEVDLASNVAIHVYRESDIPNRHGHCNSNPYIPNALRMRLGMELLPEKACTRSSKIRKKYTQ